jgi:hypothetical protein
MLDASAFSSWSRWICSMTKEIGKSILRGSADHGGGTKISISELLAKRSSVIGGVFGIGRVRKPRPSHYFDKFDDEISEFNRHTRHTPTSRTVFFVHESPTRDNEICRDGGGISH